MILACIYIPQNVLPHIFGKDHRGYTLNLGGRNNYSFSQNANEVILSIESSNKNFIANFWGNGMSLISSIVGKNAVGKSSILRALNHGIDPRSKKLIFLFEIENATEYIIVNESEISLSVNLSGIVKVLENRTSIQTLYYSPSLDFELTDTFSPISLINYFDDNFENFFLDSVARNINFLNDPVIEEVKNIYEDFPSYNKIEITIKKLKKSRLRAPYLEANFGNPHRGDALKNELSGEILRLQNDSLPNQYSKEEVIDLLERSIRVLESESFTEQFNYLWDMQEYKYSDESGYDYIHNSSDLIQNLEVNILSFLLLGATFARTGLGGGITFSEIAETSNFDERLDFMLEMYLVNEYKALTESIKIKLEGIRLIDSQNIIDIIQKDQFAQISGIQTQPIKEKMIRYTKSFNAISDFYRYIVQSMKLGLNKENKGSLLFNINNHEDKIMFDEFIYKYKFILKEFPKCPVEISLFDFSPDKKLSTGEKAILDLYSSLYDYIEKNKESAHTNYDYYLLLLDEPEIGFHPVWKKKFINAVSRTLPIIFSKINPTEYNVEMKKYLSKNAAPSLQILFTTHDPLTLSDIPNSNIVYIDKANNHSFVLDKKNKPRKSFGANITDLLADSFFINNGLIGDFARDKINTTIDWLNKQKKIKDDVQDDYLIDETAYEHHKKIIETIDEHVIKLKLAEMLEELKGEKRFREELIDREIAYLQFTKRNL